MKRRRAKNSRKRARPAAARSRIRRAGKKKAARRKARGAPRFLKFCADAGMVVFTGALILAGFIAYFARDLPSTDGLWRSERAPQLTILAVDGSPITVHGQSFGAPIRLAELPDYVPQAILAVEDRSFYHHVGFNPISVVRALLVNAAEGEVRQGGSTLTQQLAKNLFLSSERTFKRKVQELILAFWLEHRFTKDEILTLYLNRVYFGAGAYGVDAAAYRYFEKPARRLTVSEAAILAGLLKAPSHYAPHKNPQDAGARARLVVEAMVDAGFITRSEATEIYAQPVMLGAGRYAGAPYFVDYAVSEARRLSGAMDADLIVRTSYDPNLQRAMEAGVRAGLARKPLAADIQIAALILDRDGAVRAMIGGRDYAASQFNRVVQAHRQPGSAFKPFVYLAALEQGAAPSDVVSDTPIKLGKWAPDNYNSRYYGDVTMTEALARSLNGATLRVQEAAGRNAVKLAARRMGITSKLSPGAALGLGVDTVTPLELAGAYAPLANGGFQVNVHGLSEIKTSDGDLVYRHPAQMVEVAASGRSIDALNYMLRAVPAWGTGRAAALEGVGVAGKTGTTQGNRDAWFAGHAGGLVAVVWVGRDDNKPMAKGKGGNITGGTAPAIIWHEIMARALATRTPIPSVAPPPILAPVASSPIAPANGQKEDPVKDLLREIAPPRQ